MQLKNMALNSLTASALAAAAFAFTGYLKNKSKDEKEELDVIEIGKVTIAGFIAGAASYYGLQLDESTSVMIALLVVTIGKNIYTLVSNKLKQ